MFDRAKKIARPLAVVWLLIISVLFFLPGSALPKEDWLDAISFDKWVHVGFFAGLLFLWRFYFPTPVKYSLISLVIAVAYGLAVEVIQHYLVANRSFDLGDLVADTAGSFLGLWFWARVYKKNRPL